MYSMIEVPFSSCSVILQAFDTDLKVLKLSNAFFVAIVRLIGSSRAKDTFETNVLAEESESFLGRLVK